MWRGRRRDSYLMRRRRPSFPSSLAAGALGSDELPSAVVPPSLWTEGATRRCSYWAGLEDTLTAHRASVRIHDLAQKKGNSRSGPAVLDVQLVWRWAQIAQLQTKKNIQARTHHVHSGLTFHHVHSSTGESRSCMLLTSTSTFSQKKNLLVIHAKNTQKKKKNGDVYVVALYRIPASQPCSKEQTTLSSRESSADGSADVLDVEEERGVGRDDTGGGLPASAPRPLLAVGQRRRQL